MHLEVSRRKIVISLIVPLDCSLVSKAVRTQREEVDSNFRRRWCSVDDPWA